MSQVIVHPDTEKEFFNFPGAAVILTIIAKNILDKEDKIRSLRHTIYREIAEWERQKALLQDFEARHRKELHEICPAYLKPMKRNSRPSYLLSPIKYIDNLINGNKKLLEIPEDFDHPLSALMKMPQGYSEIICDNDFFRLTGWEHQTTTNILGFLIMKGLVSPHEFGENFCYCIHETIYLDREKQSRSNQFKLFRCL